MDLARITDTTATMMELMDTVMDTLTTMEMLNTDTDIPRTMDTRRGMVIVKDMDTLLTMDMDMHLATHIMELATLVMQSMDLAILDIMDQHHIMWLFHTMDQHHIT